MSAARRRRAIFRDLRERPRGFARGAAVVASLAASWLCGRSVHADPPVPPWIDPHEVPPPAWARSVVAQPDDLGQPRALTLYSGPNRGAARRGTTRSGASLPFYALKRGPGCNGPWWLIGPWAWACSDDASLSPSSPESPESPPVVNGLSLRYFFVGVDGASAYASLDTAREGTEDRELEPGWAFGAAEERATGPEERWVRTASGLWVARHDLAPARPSAFHGEAIEGPRIDVGWIVADRASVWASPSIRQKPSGSRARFDRVVIRANAADVPAAPPSAGESARMLQIDDGAWVLARDVARPSVTPPPVEVTGAAEHWIDVDTATQTLVAYEGARPVYATLVSTGRGAPGSDNATPPGIHRIWVKLWTSDMDNVERDDVTQHYSMQDVPYVQFFDGAVALHGTYWHRDFGRPHSHGCVNLAPIDARWLFDFTEPHLPDGWFAVLPTPGSPATVVRIR